MAINLKYLNQLSHAEVAAVLGGCCGSRAWINRVSANLPAKSAEDFKRVIDQAFAVMTKDDWLEAFSHHPMIGDVKTIREKFASTAHFATSEQAGVAHASDHLFAELAEYNTKYRGKFGFIFIICASGKSASFMLDELKKRYENELDTEIELAAAEQKKITWLRLEKVGT